MGVTQIWIKKTNGTRRGHITPATKGIEKSHPKLVGVLLYYSRVVDPTILVGLGAISVNQPNRNETTAQAIKTMLDYRATHPY